jgi:hypothetical protein
MSPSDQGAAPPRPLCPDVRLRELDGTLELSYWRPALLRGYFLLLWVSAFPGISFFIFFVQQAPAAFDPAAIPGIAATGAGGLQPGRPVRPPTA